MKHPHNRFPRIAFVLLFLCTALLFSCDSHTSSHKNGDTTEMETQSSQILSDTPIYTIVRSDSAGKEEIDAAVRLRNELRDNYNMDVTLTTDWIKRGEDVESNRMAHEIVFGKTNRAESAPAYEALKLGTPDMLDYAITASENGSHYVLAAADGCYDDAVTVLLSRIKEDSTILYKAAFDLNENRQHAFPLSDMTFAGVSVSQYGGIVYPASYNTYRSADAASLSTLIFEGCGISLPVMKDDDANAANDTPMIRIGTRTEEDVRSAGDFSYALSITEQGILIDGQDVWGDSRGLDQLKTLISDGIASGENTLSIGAEQSVRLLLPQNKPTLMRAAWVIAAPDMTEEAQFAEIKDCGFNLVIIQRPDDNALFDSYCKWLAKYELKALWFDGSARVYDFDPATPLHGEDFVKLDPDGYLNTDVTWGHMLRDEPNAYLFDALAEAYQAYDAIADDDKVGYINLFPSYATPEQLGNPTYEAHLSAFFDTVQPAYASVDIYPLNTGGGINGDYFYNLDTFSAECRQRGIPFSVYIQSVSFAATKRTPNEQEMRWQAYCALSFGAQNIEFFTYRTPNSDAEPFKDALIARSGDKTENWYGAQKVNEELKLLSDAYMQHRSLGAFTVNANAGAYMQFDGQYTDFDAIEDVTVSRDKPVLIGAFANDETGGYAFTCVNLGDPGYPADPITVTVTLSGSVSDIQLYCHDTVSTLVPDENNNITFSLSPGDGCFVVLNP